MARDLLPGTVENRRLALEDDDERVGRVTDPEEELALGGRSLLAPLRQGLQLPWGKNRTERTFGRHGRESTARRLTPMAETSKFTERTAWARNLAAPVRDFLGTESGGAVALLGAAVAALVWANSPWSDSYESFWTTKLSIQVGSDGISMDLRHWVSEGLMTFFFLVVGLEARREFDLGALRERRRIALLVFAAAGGMALAVLIFVAFNAGGAGAHGWGAAMSTDTAFALGVLALVAPRATRLRVRLLTIVVVDDLAALLVIATVYTGDGRRRRARVAAGFFCLLAGLRYAPVAWRAPTAALLAVGAWVALFESGVDPLLTGLAVGLVVSAYPPARTDLERATELTRSFREQPTPELARSAQLGVTLGDLGQRAPAVPAAPLDELRDRAAVRAREYRHPHRRAAARRRDRLAHHPGHRLRLRRRQAARGRRRAPGSEAAGGSPACAPR